MANLNVLASETGAQTVRIKSFTNFSRSIEWPKDETQKENLHYEGIYQCAMLLAGFIKRLGLATWFLAKLREARRSMRRGRASRIDNSKKHRA